MNLSELIKSVKGEQGWSHADLVERAHAAGYASFRKAHISTYINDPLRSSLYPESVRALAAALGVSTKRIHDAIGESLGYSADESDQPGAPVILSRDPAGMPDGVEGRRAIVAREAERWRSAGAAE